MGKICYNEHMIPMENREGEPLTIEKVEIKNIANPVLAELQIAHGNKNTCASPVGEIKRQIDYIMINHAYRNTVKEHGNARPEREFE